jgi:DNA mismatch repair protein MutS2
LADSDTADALAVLEFPAALALVAARAEGPLGAAAILKRWPTDDRDWIVAELELVGELLALLRRGERLAVAPVPDVRSALSRLRVEGGVLELAELAAVRDTLAAGREVATELERQREACPRLCQLRREPADRAIERMLELSISPEGELLDSASPALAAARRAVHAARERLVRRLEGMLRDMESSAVPSGASVTIRGGRYVVPVRRDARRRPEGIIHDESASAGTLFVEPTAAIELGNALSQAISAEEREVLVVLRELTQRLRPVRDTIAALHAMAVEVDTVLARARWALDLDGEVPLIADAGDAIDLRGARHPLLLARGVAVVPFDLYLSRDERTLLISGPNTGGKTVLLKTAAFASALAQSGIVPPLGPQSSLPIIRRWFVDIGDHQSLAADLSTFSAHVAMLRRILDAADRATLVVLDEIGSGTDPAEGGALAMAVLEALTSRGALTLATTHLGALKTLATSLPGVVNGSLHFDAATLSPTYRFTKGIPGRSYGLAIARRLGVDAAVLAAAERLVPEAERELDQLLAHVEARRQVLERDEAALAERLADVERREAVTAITAESQDARATELRRAEKEAARDRARQAKAYLLEARKRVEEALAAAHGAVTEAAAREVRRQVEDGVREQARLLDEDEPLLAPSADAIAVGSRVRLTTGAVGIVAELRGDGRAVVQLGAMRLVVTANSLTRVADDRTQRQRSAPVSSVDTPDAPLQEELDLRGMRADEAESLVIAALDAAVLADQPRLAIIHGMGTGVLRDVVRRLLAADKRVAAFDFAPRQQGGLGVTVAVLA